MMSIDTSQPLTIEDARRIAAELHDAGHFEGALRIATELHRTGHFEDAYTIYERILEAQPEHPDALHFMAIMAYQQGHLDDALRLMTHSVELVPDHPGFRSNLGNMLLDNERFEAAEQEYRHALALDPDRPDVLNNYAVLCKGLGRNEEAERCFLRAIDLAPDFIDARTNLAGFYGRLGRLDESAQQACEALIRDPRSAQSREMLGYAYCRLRRFDEAAQIYRQWLLEEPDNPKAQHHLAACTGQGIPPRAPDAYVQYVFDRFAASFESKLAKLDYRAPALVGEAVSACLGAAGADLLVLDAGCGTGLCAPLLKPYARRLVGVDLSDGMLAKARGRGLYDDLHQAELTAYMRQQPQHYDLIVSADTLVYFGDLEAVMHAAAHALRPGGHLCFTVEALREAGADAFRLQDHGRYAHSRPYVEAMLAQAGLVLLTLDQEVLRHEGGEPVVGWLVMAGRQAV